LSRNPRVLLLTCEDRPTLTPDDELLEDAFRRRGIEVESAPWSRIPVSQLGAATLLVRSTWDYHLRIREFRRWLVELYEAGGSVWNPVETLRWNLDKVYLRHLERSGVTLPPTRWLEPSDLSDWQDFSLPSGWEKAVLKPRIGATAFATSLVTRDSRLETRDLSLLRSSGALLQAFVPEIETRGEVSLVFLAGEFSHAVRKLARTGEYRVQKDFGGTVERCAPSQALLGFARRVIDATPVPWLYARVDVVEAAGGPVLMELELIEPDLFFTHGEPGADRLAAAVIERAREAAA
jgi:glutathione synthase/RimK-type ligase-like ATP-grasp enzyme